jgi:hypothetical protein
MNRVVAVLGDDHIGYETFDDFLRTSPFAQPVQNESSDHGGEDLRKKVITEIRRLRELKVTALESEILNNLLGGRKTAVELVDHIFGSTRNEPGFHAEYLRVLRALKGLEKRGLVSTRLFGREKPYRLTNHGIAIIASIVPDNPRPKVVAKQEFLLLVATALLGIFALWYARGIGEPISMATLTLFAGFFVLIGVSASVFLRVLMRVI